MTNIDPSIVEALLEWWASECPDPDDADFVRTAPESIETAQQYAATLTPIIAAAVDAARAEGYEQGKADGEAQAREQFRRHIISDPEMHALHEAAKAYSLACSALAKVRGGPLSTTLAFLIEQGYLVPVDPRAALKATP